MILLLMVAAASAAVAHLLLLRTSPAWSWPQRALAGLVGVVVLLQSEVLALSLLPVHRPLVALPWLHVALVLFGAAWAVRQLGARAAAQALLPCRPRTGPGELLIAAAVVLTLLGIAAWGFVSGPTGVDELAYHVPQAALLHQDADLARPLSYLPWTYAYPQGASSLWGFTMFFTGDDRAFHAVQALLGAQLALATYVLGRRSGAPRTAGLLSALALVTAPVFFRMTTISTADICFASGVVTAVAFLAPRPSGPYADDLRVALLGLAQACSAKIPVLAVLVVGAAALHAAVLAWRRRGATHPWKWRPPLDAALLLAVLGSVSTYVVNALEHDNPAWPLALHVAGEDLPGPLAAFTDHTIGAQTSFGVVAEMSRLQLWTASFFDWDQALTEDSLGAFGPVVAVVGLAMLLVCLVLAIRRRDSWLLTLLAVVAVGLVAVPVLFVPRYGLPVIALVLALGAVGARSVPRVPPAAVLVLVAGCAVATLPSVHLARDARAWYAANAGPDTAWWKDRGRSVAENHRLNDPTAAQSPSLVRYVRSSLGAGDTLAYDITTYPTLLWNEDFSNRIRYVPGSRAEAYPIGPHTLPPVAPAELQRWQRQLEEVGADQVAVYTASGYDDALLAAGWTVAYSDPPEDGRAAVTVLSRAAGP